MTRYYRFDTETGEFTGEYLDSDKRFPADHASLTSEMPPGVEEGNAARWTDGAWELVEDYRGKTVYDKQTGAAREHRELGPLPDEVTLDEPGPYDKWVEGVWVE